jgi:glycerol-3-phosphate acyltransferase PlsY
LTTFPVGYRLHIMVWLIVLLSYLIGAVPTAYIAGRLTAGIDIRQIGDDNMGAANTYRELGTKIGLTVFFLDAAKGALVIIIAKLAHFSQEVVLLCGVAAVAGHNWPVYLGFRGGRGESTTIGILFVLVSLPMLIMTVPALLILILKKNVILASAVLFIPLSLLGWWLHLPSMLIAYSIALPCLVGFTHFLRVRKQLLPG